MQKSSDQRKRNPTKLCRDDVAMKSDIRRVENRMGRFDKRMDGFDKRMDRFEKKTERGFVKVRLEMREGFDDAKRYMGILHEDLSHKIDLLLEGREPAIDKLENHESRILRIEERLPVLEAAVNRKS